MANPGSQVTVVDGGGPPPPSHDQRDATRTAQRASLAEELAQELAGLDGGTEDKPQAAAEEKPEKPEEPEAKPEPEKAKAKDEEPDEDEADEEEDSKDAEPEEEPKAAKPDKDLQKRLAAVQREEKRAKAALAEERKSVADERRAVEREREQVREELGRVKKALEQFKYDPVAFAREAGVEEDAFEDFARAYYAASAKGKADPRLRSEVQRSARDREYDDRMARLEQQNRALQERIEQQSLLQQATQWIEETVKSVTDETPLVQRMIETSPQKARQRIAAVAQRLAEEYGEDPDHEDVVVALEKIRREELEELGIDVDSAIKANPKNKPVQPAAKTKPAKALDKDLRTQAVQPRSQPMSRDERRRAELDQLVADMAAGRLDA